MPSKSKVIAIKITSGVKGQPLTVRNRTTGDVLNETIPQAGKATVDLQNFVPSGYTEGDVIDISVAGERIGSNSLTTSGDAPQSITVGTAAINTAVLVRGVR